MNAAAEFSNLALISSIGGRWGTGVSMEKLALDCICSEMLIYIRLQ